MEKFISETTNLLHSVGKNKIRVSDFVNIDKDIDYQENSLNIYKIQETVVDSSLKVKVNNDGDKPEKPNLQPETEMSIKSLCDAKILLKT